MHQLIHTRLSLLFAIAVLVAGATTLGAAPASAQDIEGEETPGTLAVPGSSARIHVVGQKNKKFTKEEITISVGEAVRFENNDPFFHNVYSLSPTRSFDLGSYPQGKSKTVLFDKPGTVDVECAIHPRMHMTIQVKPAPAREESTETFGAKQ